MNQILYKCFKEEIKPTKKKKFLIIFIIAIILIICTIIFYIFIKYKLHVNENISKNILNNYKIMTLYSNTIDNYNCSAFYEPSYVIARAYQAGGF